MRFWAHYKVALVFLLILAGMCPLWAQKPDTLYIYETVIEHDTLISRDTTWIHDTVFLHKTTVPNDTPKTTSPSYYPEYQEEEDYIEEEEADLPDKSPKHPKKERSRPQWLYEDLYSHEIKLEVCDPYLLALFDRYFVYVYPQGMSPAVYRNKNLLGFSYHISPLYSLSTHFRINKWFWFGVMVGYAHIDDIESRSPLLYTVHDMNPAETNTGPICIRRYNIFTLMPELRFSYLNREHVTLYSGLSIGITKFFGKFTILNIEEEGPIHPYFTTGDKGNSAPTLFASAHVTLIGVKLGWKHWFASAEIGVGFKGIGAVGVGYEF
jgi:hypothetical protein